MIVSMIMVMVFVIMIMLMLMMMIVVVMMGLSLGRLVAGLLQERQRGRAPRRHRR